MTKEEKGNQVKPYPKVSLTDLKDAVAHGMQITDKTKPKDQAEKINKTFTSELVVVTR